MVIACKAILYCIVKDPTWRISKACESIQHGVTGTVGIELHAPVGLRTTICVELENVSWVIGSMWRPLEPSGTGVKRTGTRSLSLSFLPLAGQTVSKSGLSSFVLVSGA